MANSQLSTPCSACSLAAWSLLGLPRALLPGLGPRSTSTSDSGDTSRSEVLLFDEPTRGIDVAAKDMIYQLLHDLAAAGKAVVVVSSELTELMSLCDRIIVMSAGRIAGEFLPGQWSQEKMTHAAFSGYLDRDHETLNH